MTPPANHLARVRLAAEYLAQVERATPQQIVEALRYVLGELEWESLQELNREARDDRR